MRMLYCTGNLVFNKYELKNIRDVFYKIKIVVMLTVGKTKLI